MFTGIVAAVGHIETVESLGEGAGVRLSIDAGALDLADVAIGDSIAIQGACMTVITCHGSQFTVDVSRESLSKTAGLGEPGPVNLEKAMRLSDRLGGHLVSGHVDGLGEVVRFEQSGESWLLDVRVPVTLGRYFAYKGSATINGVSLTVNEVDDEGFEVALIPHTVAHTRFAETRVGEAVNLEIDLIARYVARMMDVPAPAQ